MCTFRRDVNENEQNVKHPKLKFLNSSNNLVETLPRSMHVFLGVNLLCTFKGDVI